MKNKRIVDLSHELLPGQEEYHLNLKTHFTDELYPQYKRDENVWYILQDMEMSSHCGTHVEFPYHHNRHGADAARFPLERLVCDCVLLDFKHKADNEAVTLDELIKIESKIEKGDMVLFNFGRAKNYRTEKSHDRPFIALDAIDWLINEKNISLIGSDASGIEIKNVPNQPVHQMLMDNGVPIIEFAANLDELKQERFTLFVLALRVRGLDSCPVRLIALEDNNCDC
ncbi:MAG: cyclase family protein [Defluviitaleaceae bacterium]|nr:cyclase family protein [Defluviitaleaceae bacterium]